MPSRVLYFFQDVSHHWPQLSSAFTTWQTLAYRVRIVLACPGAVLSTISSLLPDQQNAVWPSSLPDRHIQVGWRYKFPDPLSADLCTLLMGACRNLKKSSEIHGYWQTGLVMKVGSVSVHFAYHNSTLDVIGRCRITHGSKQALNVTWCVLCQFCYVIEVLLSNCKGICPEVGRAWT